MIDAARITYRSAEASDAQILADCARETFVATFGALYPIADLNHFIATTYGADLQRGEILDPHTRHRLAFDAAELIGFAKMGAYKLPLPAPEKRPRELHRLYVRAEAKGSGVAAALMDWVLACAREDAAGALYLGVYQGNERAQRFYARYGFEIVGEYEFEVGAVRDPEYVMRRAMD